ncbi:selenium cofactor biosynthesis protein YqeC [Atopobiaceae bacterium 24-176]
MKVQFFLQVVPGITPVVGSGGKTSLIALLASSLPGTSVLCTTTRIFPFDGVPCLDDAAPDEVARALRSHQTVCVGAPADCGKLAEPSCGVRALEPVADHVLVEADGSKRLPLKAHCPWEPVVPDDARPAILVVGASGFGLSVARGVHRPNAFCAIVGGCPSDIATPEHVARAVAAENLATTVFVNQVDPGDEAALQAARKFAAALREQGYTGRVGAGSVRADWAQEL